MNKTARQWKDCYSSLEFNEKYVYEGGDLGALCTQKETSFRLWSPFAEKITLNLYREGDGVDAFETHAMTQGDKGVWNYRTDRNLHGIYYDYTVEMEGSAVFSSDPYARACGINGKRSMAVDLSKTDPSGWEEDKAPEKEAETVIYELHVREFSWDKSGGFPEDARGKYKAFLYDDTTLYNDGVHPTGLSYLKKLGVNYVQLMPVYDYGSVDESKDEESREFNWGYDPVNYNVPEGSYATDPKDGTVRIREFKEMIQSLHRQGFRVIMDVVYNHTYSTDSCFQKTAPWYFYRVDEDGEFSNGSGCGNDVASEMPMCGKYILESVLYWAGEYHIDGFRFDLMGLLDVDLMNRIRKALDKRYGRGEKILFGEPWSADTSPVAFEKKLALKKHIGELDIQTGMFCDDTRDAVKGPVGKAEEPGFVNGAPDMEEEILKSVTAWCGKDGPGVKAPSQIITYVSSHDDHTLWDKLSGTTRDEKERRKQYRLAVGIYMTCQGHLFFLSGEEFARTKNGIRDTYNAPISLNRLDWERAWKEEKLTEYYGGLIALRKQIPGLCDKTAEAWKRIAGSWTKEGMAGFTVENGEAPSLWREVKVIYNRRKTMEEIALPGGAWEILADGENSRLWENPKTVKETVKVPAVSILILGKRRLEA